MAKKGHLIDAGGLATSSRDAGDLTPITDVFMRTYTKEYTSGNKDMSKEFKEKMDGIIFSNDGNSKIAFIINRMIIEAQPGDVLEMTFVPFQKIIVFSDGVPYRFWGVNALKTVESGSSLLVQDDFERIPTTGLGKAKTGQSWETYDSQGIASTNWSISSGKAKVDGTNFQTAVIDSGMKDFYSLTGDVKLAAGGTASNYGGLMISYVDANNNLFFRAEGSDNTIRLYAATAPATYSLLTSKAFTFTDGQTVKFKVIKKGKSLEIFADGVSVLTYTMTDEDQQRTASTKQGLFFKSKEAEGDNFEVSMLEV